MTENLLVRWIIICVALVAAAASIQMNWGESGPLALGIDLRGGYSIRYSISPKSLEEFRATAGNLSQALDETIRVISARIDTMGLREMTIRRGGEGQIIIEAPRLSEGERDEIKDRMLQLGKLEFPIGLGGSYHKSPNKPVNIPGKEIGQTTQYSFDETRSDAQRDAELKRPGTEYRDGLPYQLKNTDQTLLPIWWYPWTPSTAAEDLKISVADARRALQSARAGEEYNKEHIKGNWVYLDAQWWGKDYDEKQLPGFTGEMISKVRRTTDQVGARAVSYEVDRQRQFDFEEYTEKYINWPMLLVLNDEIWSAPNIESALSDNVMISGGAAGFSVEEQDHLVTALQSGSLRLRPQEEGEYEIAASLGTDSVNRGVSAAALGMLLVVIFLLIYYRFGGIVANIALLLNLTCLVAILALFQATLTLPGIAGIILTIGMAVDANILIFERVREELSKGKTIMASVQAGYNRAFVTIVDANLTTFLTAVILYQYGVGPIKGFAVTLMTGIVCSLFCGVFISRAIFGLILKKELISSFKMAQLVPHDMRIGFLNKARMAAMLSIIGLVLALGIFFNTGDKKYGLDFTGGANVQVSFTKYKTTGEVADAIRTVKDASGVTKYTEISPIGLVEFADPKDKTRFKRMEIQVQSRPDVTSKIVTATFKRSLEGALAEGLFEVRAASREKEGEDWNLTFILKEPAVVTDTQRTLETFGDPHSNGKKVFMALDLTAVDKKADPDLGIQSAREYVLSIPDSSLAGQDAVADLDRLFTGELDPVKKFPKIDYVGPNVVSGLKKAAIVAVILSLIAVILYIWFRFKELKYGVAAAVAVFHDVIIALGVVVLVNLTGLVHVPLNLSIIAGFLTIIGYSLNDTIVLFDRVRENLGNIEGSYRDVVNTSINHTLARTLLTSLTTFVVVAVLFGWNYNMESPIEGIAFTLMVGVVVGTYSSIFIASPVLVWLHNREEQKVAKPKGS